MTQDAMTQRKPRIALMGEFSAGKSTLSNLLLGARPLPEKVTATRLSPVWMAGGAQPPYRITEDGTEELVSIDHLEEIPVEETKVIRLFFESDILDVCDLIDFPGISDPNMSTNVVERMLEEVDAVLWCTHATQAWRQSEQAFWEQMPEAVKQRSILLITRFDKLTTERDRNRVYKRVLHETKGQFGGTFPISLLQALRAGDDVDKWDASGAGAFSDHLIEVVQELKLAVAGKAESLFVLGQRGEAIDVASSEDALVLNDPVAGGRDPAAAPVMPRRVRPSNPAKVSAPAADAEAPAEADMATKTQIAS